MTNTSIARKPAKVKCYTVVDDMSEVTVYRSLKSVSESMAAQRLYLGLDWKKARFTEGEAKGSDIATALRKNRSVCLYPLFSGEWLFKIEKHSRIY